MNPRCPSDYSCQFTLVHPRVIYHNTGPWWEHAAGFVVGLFAIFCLTIVLIYIVFNIIKMRDERHREIERKAERQHKIAIEEQRTLQLDAAKGNTDMLKIIREMQRQ